MTSANVTGISSYFANNVGNNGKMPEAENGDSFSQIFDKTTQLSGGQPNDEASVKNTRKEDAVNVQEHANASQKTSFRQPKTEDTQAVEEKEVEEAVLEAAGMLVQKTAEIFQVSVEEVEQVLEELGLTPLALLNQENLPQLVMAFHPESDALTIMTDENLFGDLKALMNTLQDALGQLETEYSLTTEQLQQLMNIMQESDSHQIMPQQPQETDSSSLADSWQAPDTMVTQEESSVIPVTVEVKKDKDSSETLRKQDSSMAEAISNSMENKESQLQRTQGTLEHGKEENQGNNKEGNQALNQTSFTQTVVNNLAEAVEEANAATSYSGVDGRSIMEQITDYIKVNVSSDTTEMELQLHPASLGAVKVQVASAGGVLTATFTTQNEAVKAALETQLIQLKENFEQQGLKVESIEVNVSAQGFERSLEGEQGREQFEQQRQKGNRRIRLQGLGGTEEELIEDLLPEDQVIADMMIRNGNTVDYIV